MLVAADDAMYLAGMLWRMLLLVMCLIMRGLLVVVVKLLCRKFRAKIHGQEALWVALLVLRVEELLPHGLSESV